MSSNTNSNKPQDNCYSGNNSIKNINQSSSQQPELVLFTRKKFWIYFFTFAMFQPTAEQ